MSWAFCLGLKPCFVNQALVEQARKDIQMKDENIFRLTKEVVELRLLRDEVDGEPAKLPVNVEDSPVFKVR